MKKSLLIFIISLLLLYGTVVAQAPFNTFDSVDINNINARLLVHGDMFWDPTDSLSKTFFPNGTTKINNFAAALWVSGYDSSGKLHLAAEAYRINGIGYWPGPLDSSDTITYATSQNWAKIWKVNRSDIQYFQSISIHTTANTPTAILTWPANGNAYAQGNGGVPLTINEDMAPFVDLNGDGIYEPLEGEYPDVPGDQALWWVFSDNGPAPSEAKGIPLDIEVHAMAYAYGMRGTLIDNVIYYNYKIINKSTKNYSNTRIAFWDDIDLGWRYDDYMGFDSTWRMGIDYNGTECDGCSAGNPPNSYGTYIPQSAITLVNEFRDSINNYIPIGSFTIYNNDNSIEGNPYGDTQYNYYIRGANRLGILTNYIYYTGSATDTSQLNECSLNDEPTDKRFVLTTEDFDMVAGGSYNITYAFITTNPDSNNGCPTETFDSIRVVADTAWAVYQNPLPPIPAGISNINVPGDITIYPNPASDILYIKTAPNAAAVYYEIHDIVGDLMQQGNLATGTNSIDINLLPAGVYILTTSTGNGQRVVRKFVKL